MDPLPPDSNVPQALPESADHEPKTPPPPSYDELKAAYKAFKKRLKFKQLDLDSRVGRSPTSSGSTKIAGIEPPDQYPKAVWDALVRQKKLKYSGQGMYEMP